MMPLDEDESCASRATTVVAVIHCTVCGYRWAHTTDAGVLTTIWRLTRPEVSGMQFELSKIHCRYCDGSIDVRVLESRRPFAGS